MRSITFHAGRLKQAGFTKIAKTVKVFIETQALCEKSVTNGYKAVPMALISRAKSR